MAVISVQYFHSVPPFPSTVSVVSSPMSTEAVTLSPPTTVSKQSAGPVPTIPFSLPSGFTIHVFAKNLGTPRDLVISPGGTLLVSNPSGNQVFALPDKNNEGVTDENKIIISQGNHVHGLAFYGGKLFVAEVNRVVRYTWDETSLTSTLDKVLFTLPDSNDHNSRTITFDATGTMYVSVGSTCNVCHETSNLSATVIISNSNGDNLKVFASGLRNAPFILFNPTTHELWSTEMGRDYLGDNTPPDEINIIRSGNDYGWPYCYGNKIHDDNFDPAKQHSCDTTQSPIFEIPAHSAPLGLTFIQSSQFPTDWQHDLLVSYHGSWNRTVPDCYKVVHLKISGNTITSSEDFLTGFIQTGSVKARPVDLVFDTAGNLYLSDDKSGNVYIIQKTP